jgi:pantoate--beta-alanine ligase
LTLRVIESARELFAITESYRACAQRVGLVPTMGALHEGHLSLIDATRTAGAARVLVSIFVNPLQFGAREDLSKYPRTFAADLALCEARGVDLVYAPSSDAMYPKGFQTQVEVEQLSRDWEGSVRPGHFGGVATVVTKLFAASGACVAAFGRKDYQQLRIVQQLVSDLDLPVEVLACPIVREPDGLALSSRNRYLDPAARVRAAAIYRGLHAASSAFAHGERDASRLTQLARAPVAASFDAIDYVSVVDARDLSPASSLAPESRLLLVAARLAETRLIDNCVLGQECLTSD